MTCCSIAQEFSVQVKSTFSARTLRIAEASLAHIGAYTCQVRYFLKMAQMTDLCSWRTQFRTNVWQPLEILKTCVLSETKLFMVLPKWLMKMGILIKWDWTSLCRFLPSATRSAQQLKLQFTVSKFTTIRLNLWCRISFHQFLWNWDFHFVMNSN